MTSLTVRDEAYVLELLKRALNEEFEGQTVEFLFENWPVIEVRYEGPQFHSSLTPPIMEALVGLQKKLNRTYAELVKQQSSAAHLTEEDKKHIEFQAEVTDGSSVVKVDLGPFAMQLAADLVGKMSSTQIVLTVLGIGTLAASSFVIKKFISSKTEEKKIDTETKERIALSQEETRRLEIFAEVKRQSPVIQRTEVELNETKRELLKAAPEAERVELNGVVVSRDAARAVAASTRTESEETQLNGYYLITNVSFEHDREYRVRLKPTDYDLDDFTAVLIDESFDREQVTLLKNAAFAREPIYLSVNARVLRGQVTTAKIVSVHQQPLADPHTNAS